MTRIAEMKLRMSRTNLNVSIVCRNFAVDWDAY